VKNSLSFVETEVSLYNFFHSWGGMRLIVSPLGTSVTIGPIASAPDDI
jgi:hypothetical protein